MNLDNLTVDEIDFYVSRAEHERIPANDGKPVVVKPYSSDRDLAQTIIDREHIKITVTFDENDMERPSAQISPHGLTCTGDTDLEAAMLCYVLHVYGRQLLH